MNAITRAAGSSAVVRRLRHYSAGSAVCAAAVAITRWPRATRWLRQTHQRILVGFGGEWTEQEERRTVEQLDALASSSRIVAGISSLGTTTLVAWRESALRRALGEVLGVKLDHRIRIGGFAIIVAVLTHTVLLWLLDVPVQTLGWSTRVFLLIIGAVGLRRSEAVAAALRDWQARW